MIAWTCQISTVVIGSIHGPDWHGWGHSSSIQYIAVSGQVLRALDAPAHGRPETGRGTARSPCCSPPHTAAR